jgi:hypothetical protein
VGGLELRPSTTKGKKKNNVTNTDFKIFLEGPTSENLLFLSLQKNK